MPGTALLRAGFLLALGLLVLFTAVLISTLARRLGYVVRLLWLYRPSRYRAGTWSATAACCSAPVPAIGAPEGRRLRCTPLTLTEWGLVAVGSRDLHALIWVQLAEIAQVFKPGVAPRPQA